MIIRPLTVCFTLSVSIHIAWLVFSRFQPVEGEINPADYKLVMLMDMEPAAPAAPKSPETEGELKVTRTDPTDVKEFPKEEVKPVVSEGPDFSMYLPFFKVASLPEFIEKTRPEYPVSARIRNQESEVLVETYIDENGKLRKVTIIRSGGREFDESVLKALNKSRFKPAISKEGQAVPVRVRIPFKFELD